MGALPVTLEVPTERIRTTMDTAGPREFQSPVEIVWIFAQEFVTILDKFHPHDLSVSDAAQIETEHVWKPGCYVFWHPNRVVKVGRSFSNARKRALEHIRDNTGDKLAALADEDKARLVLFSLKDPNEYHWAASVEVFLERELTPEVKSLRTG